MEGTASVVLTIYLRISERRVLMELIDKLKELIYKFESIYVGGKLNVEDVIELLYKHTDGDLLPHFMIIDKLRKEEQKKEDFIKYQAIQDGMHQVSTLSRYLLEEKTARQARDIAKYYFKREDGNVSSLINIAKAYFKDGTSKGCSLNGVWWFNQFVTLLNKNKCKYLEGGISHEWAKDFGHLEYIKLVLEKNK